MGPSSKMAGASYGTGSGVDAITLDVTVAPIGVLTRPTEVPGLCP